MNGRGVCRLGRKRHRCRRHRRRYDLVGVLVGRRRQSYGPGVGRRSCHAICGGVAAVHLGQAHGLGYIVVAHVLAVVAPHLHRNCPATTAAA